MAKRKIRIEYNGQKYRSFKHLVLEYIFNQKTTNRTIGIGEDHEFTLKDVGDVLAHFRDIVGGRASFSNFVLDLTRKDIGIQSRLPDSVIEMGYDLRKKTGRAPDGTNYAGVFVFVGVGNVLKTWFEWPNIPDSSYVLSNYVPYKVAPFLAKDEGALFSVIDYCDVLSQVLYGQLGSVLRVQTPMKWQPNEIDGLYFSDYTGVPTLFPIEAKALSTGDALNLEQMSGAYRVMQQRRPDIHIVPLGIKMIENGIYIVVFRGDPSERDIEQCIMAHFDPPILTWYKSVKMKS